MGPILRRHGFHLLVLCAEEYQPPHQVPGRFQALLESFSGEPFPGVEVVYAPNADDFIVPPSREQLASAVQAAESVVAALRAGKKVLVTCWAGLNRSGLVTALSLHKLRGMSGVAAIQQVKRYRKGALSNPHFQSALANIPSKRNRKRSPYPLG